MILEDYPAIMQPTSMYSEKESLNELQQPKVIYMPLHIYSNDCSELRSLENTHASHCRPTKSTFDFGSAVHTNVLDTGLRS